MNKLPLENVLSKQYDLTDEIFMQQFEALNLDSSYFCHVGHLRITWLYLTKNNFELALSKVLKGIKQYATSLGAKEKFHYTLTVSSVRIIQKRQYLKTELNFSDFLRINQDLYDNFIGLVEQYYSPNLLNSQQAKVQYIEPDRKKF